MSHIRYPIDNNLYPTSDIRHPASSIDHSTLSVLNMMMLGRSSGSGSSDEKKDIGEDLLSPLTSSLSPSANGNGESSLISLRVKSSIINNNKNITVRISPSDAVEIIKEITRDTLGPDAQGRYLRLICKGRLLTPDTATLKDFPSIKDGDVIHAVLAAPGVRGGQQAALSRGSTQRRYRGTGVGPGGRAVRPTSDSLDSDSDDDGNNSDVLEEGRERLGFDRLRSSGLSRHEISAIRIYFSRNVDRYVEQHPDEIEDQESGLTRRHMYEDAWMQVQGPASEFRFNLNQSGPIFARGGMDSGVVTRTAIGTDRDFLWGFLLGFFVGFLMLVWVWMPTVPHKQKLGILTGISVQLALSVFQTNGEGDNGSMDLDGV